MKRRARLFAIAEHLRGRRAGVTADALAARFGVTVRTIYRDLDDLRDAELPITAERGRGGGFALDRAYTLPPVSFSAREAALLVTLGRFAHEMRLLPFSETLEAALDKVRGALSASSQRELLALTHELRFVGVPALPIAPGVRAVLERAWFERAPMTVRYRGRDGITAERTVRLTSVVMERGVTLLNCLDLDKHEARQLRLDRVEDARITAEEKTGAPRPGRSGPATSGAASRRG